MFIINVDHDEDNEIYTGTLVDEATGEIVIERKHCRIKVLLKQLGRHLRKLYKDVGNPPN